jgi:hypothetical protein
MEVNLLLLLKSVNLKSIKLKSTMTFKCLQTQRAIEFVHKIIESETMKYLMENDTKLLAVICKTIL